MKFWKICRAANDTFNEIQIAVSPAGHGGRIITIPEIIRFGMRFVFRILRILNKQFSNTAIKADDVLSIAQEEIKLELQKKK